MSVWSQWMGNLSVKKFLAAADKAIAAGKCQNRHEALCQHLTSLSRGLARWTIDNLADELLAYAEASIIFSCPSCRSEIHAPMHAEGRKAKCPRCGKPVIVTARGKQYGDSNARGAAVTPETPTPMSSPLVQGTPAPSPKGQKSSGWTRADFEEYGRVVCYAVAVFGVLCVLVTFVRAWISESNKTPEQIRQETIELRGKRLQEEMEEERARKQLELKSQIEAVKQDMKKHPERYGN